MAPLPLTMNAAERSSTRSHWHFLNAIVTPVITVIMATCHLTVVATLSTPSSSSKALIAKAISLTNQANINPSYAEEACELWSSILYESDVCKDRSLAGFADTMHALHASTLARIGRDKEALVEYKKSLNILGKSGATSKTATKADVDIRMGMGKTLQRLLRYDEAVNVFLGAARCCENITYLQNKGEASSSWESISHSESVRRATLCSMRLGDLDSAIAILESMNNLPGVQKEQDAEIAGMLGTLLLLKSSSSSSTSTKVTTNEQNARMADQLLQYSSEKPASPLYNWLYHTSQPGRIISRPFESLQDMGKEIYLSFADANNSPFDDPDLVNLDDKILLQSMVMEPLQFGTDVGKFWPRGFVLPQEFDSFADECKHVRYEETDVKRWILKDRAGYGSHGNRIVSINEVLSTYDPDKNSTQQYDPILCQRIVDPPMILDCRKFSLRIYVVYFPAATARSANNHAAEIFLSTEGLVKFASASYIKDEKSDENFSLDNQYMTNSGRGDGRSSKQHNLQYLRKEFENNGLDYNIMWENITQSVKIVMGRYLDLKGGCSNDFSSSHQSYDPFYSIPKVLGFDFIMDSSQNPWLLEVNRFPGLGPRSSLDSDVKHTVIYDAWVAAVNRIGLSEECILNFRPSNYKGFSLERILFN